MQRQRSQFENNSLHAISNLNKKYFSLQCHKLSFCKFFHFSHSKHNIFHFGSKTATRLVSYWLEHLQVKSTDNGKVFRHLDGKRFQIFLPLQGSPLLFVRCFKESTGLVDQKCCSFYVTSDHAALWVETGQRHKPRLYLLRTSADQMKWQLLLI
jgi:hypothetical protein